MAASRLSADPHKDYWLRTIRLIREASLRTRKSVIAALAIGVLAGATQALAQSKIWTDQGPGPLLNDTSTTLPGMNPSTGAINAIVPSKSSADVVFVGTVNGGVWKTSNATATAPTWIPLTDHQLPELSIQSLAVSPVNSNTLFAGTGSTSSHGHIGGPGIGLAHSIDGGQTWTLLGRATFAGRTVNSIVPTTLNGGKTILAATWLDRGGVYRSTDNGVTFKRKSGNGTSGLPDAGVTSLIADPSNAHRFYAGVPGAGAGGGALAGVYRSNDGGATWTAADAGLSDLSTSLRILLTIHNSTVTDPVTGAVTVFNVVYAAIIASDKTLGGVFRSIDHGLSWMSLDVPSPAIFPGMQGSNNGAIAADPSDPNVVFISGDRQDMPFPNDNGCSKYNASVFRYTGTDWENVVCMDASATGPHADSRGMAFDASGNLLLANDGGIARLVNPNTAGATRTWVAVDGDLKSVEFHSIAYDPVSNIILGGTQDNGAVVQSQPDPVTKKVTWTQVQGGDGGVVGIDADQVSHSGTSIRYYPYVRLQGFTRSTWDATNTMTKSEGVKLDIIAGIGDGLNLLEFEAGIPFYAAYALNAINPARMLIGTRNLYESTDRGDELTNLSPMEGGPVVGTGQYGRPIVYGGKSGGVSFPDLFYVGEGNKILHRATVGELPTTLSKYPGGNVVTIAVNPNNMLQVYVCDRQNRVWGSPDGGTTWKNLTGNLQPGLTTQVTTIAVFSLDGTSQSTTLYAGGFGVFQLSAPFLVGQHWQATTGPNNNKIPNALVLDLQYDYTKGVLVAGTLGRGAWLFSVGTGLPPPPFVSASRVPPSKSSLSLASTAAKHRPRLPLIPVDAPPAQ